MQFKEFAAQIAESGRAANAVMQDYLLRTDTDRSDMERMLLQYIALKLQLTEEEASDNITKMVRLSVSKATHIPLEKLKAMDKPGACGSAPTVLAKRVMLFLNIQDNLGVKMPPEKAADIQTVQDLTDILYPLCNPSVT